MDNVEELCDHLCVLKKGASLFTGSLLDLKEQYGKIKLSIRSELEESQLNALPGVKRVKKTKDGYTLLLENELYGEQLFQILGKGKYMEKFSMDYLSLDEIFKDLVGGEHV
jgi:ABC-type uncharacterized transport system, ATPase component